MYLLRLDDASQYMNAANWEKTENLLDRYNIKPIVGVIPENKDPQLLRFDYVEKFWSKVHTWQRKGWVIALHGYNHVYETDAGGINPVNKRSEFAGLPLDVQKEKIRKGNNIFLQHGIHTEIFYAPSHTFDLNTLQALKEETDIKVISDTIANDVYFENDFYFIPQQSGIVRKLPFTTTTFCYHPNKMSELDFNNLENFLICYNNSFISYSKALLKNRKRSLFDKTLKKIYFIKK